MSTNNLLIEAYSSLTSRSLLELIGGRQFRDVIERSTSSISPPQVPRDRLRARILALPSPMSAIGDSRAQVAGSTAAHAGHSQTAAAREKQQPTTQQAQKKHAATIAAQRREEQLQLREQRVAEQEQMMYAMVELSRAKNGGMLLEAAAEVDDSDSSNSDDEYDREMWERPEAAWEPKARRAPSEFRPVERGGRVKYLCAGYRMAYAREKCRR